MNDFAKFLEEQNLKMSELSQEFGIPYRTIQDWKSGKGHCPDYMLKMLKGIYSCDESKNKTKTVVEIEFNSGSKIKYFAEYLVADNGIQLVTRDRNGIFHLYDDVKAYKLSDIRG